MQSMTGYGRGEAHHGGVKFSVELNSVNRKQTDIVADLPREIIELEPRIRDEINAAVSRGRLNVVVAWHRAGGTKAGGVQLDEELARAYLHAIQKLQRRLKIDGSVNLDALLRCPGVLKLSESAVDAVLVWPHIEKALKQAIAGLLRMRAKEGRHLRRDLLERLDLLERGVQQIRKLAPAMVDRYREQLHERIRKAGVGISMDDERLVKEVVFFADRCDISEELTRLGSHLAQFREGLDAAGAVGRTLDFLSQELNREINTVGSKASHAEISQIVVAMKAELERIREQVQNVE